MFQWRRTGLHHRKLKLHSFLSHMHTHFNPRSWICPAIHQPLTKALNHNEVIITLCKNGRLKEALHRMDSLTRSGVTLGSETYASLLQACADENDLKEGKRLQAQIINSNFEQNLFLLNKLISMYAKCGSPLDARLVFDGMDKPNLISWNSMIRGYAMNGYYEELLKLWCKMQGEEIRADNFTYPCVLKACAGLSAMEQGKEIHGLVIRCGFESDLGVGNALVNMYAKCRSVEDARKVFDKMPLRDVVSWNVITAGYSQNGCWHEALEVFGGMRLLGEKPNGVTVATVLQACGGLEDIELGKSVHGFSIRCGLEPDVLVGNALVTVYAKCRGIEDALQLFEGINQKDVVSWNAMIAGYGQIGHCDKGLELFCEMLLSGVKPNMVTILCVLSLCASSADLRQGKAIHGYVIRSRLQLDVSLGNALVDMYSKCRSMEYAKEVFDKIDQRDRISWNTIIGGYVHNEYFADALDLLYQMKQAGVKPDSVTVVSVLPAFAHLDTIKKGQEIHAFVIRNEALKCNVSVSNALITFYSTCGRLETAYRMFAGMTIRDLISWNAMISAYAQKGCCSEAIDLFRQMEKTYLKPDPVTVSSVLSACADLSTLKLGREIHSYIIKRNNLSTNVVVGNALLDMYAKCGKIVDACHEYNNMAYRNIVSHNVMISCYAKYGDKKSAKDVFDKMSERNISSWNAMIALYIQHGYCNETLNIFRKLQLADVKPDSVTVVSILSACAHVAALQWGKEIHAYIIRRSLDSDIFVRSTIIDMYAKCGSLEDACQVFERTGKLDVVTWTAMISGYAIHGYGGDALSIFYQMQEAGLKPDHITFTAVLSACSRAGLVDEGWQCFNCMIEDYCILPNMEHYACMVDLLGRAGHLHEAHDFIKRMPLKPNESVWGALLAACKIHSNIDLGEHAAKRLFELDPKNIGNYVLLSNIYAAVGRWDEVQRMRRLIKEKRLDKIPGCSYIEVKNRVHAFLVEDISQPQMEVHNILHNFGLKKGEGHASVTNSLWFRRDERLTY